MQGDNDTRKGTSQCPIWVRSTPVGFIAARLDGPRSLDDARTIWPSVEGALASQIREVDALFGSAEMARRFSAFHLADAAAELATLAFAAAQL